MPRKKVYKKKSRKQIKEGINIFINTRPTGRRGYNRKPKTQQVSYMPYGFVNIQPSQPSYNVIEDLRSEVRKLKPLPVEPVKQIEYTQPAYIDYIPKKEDIPTIKYEVLNEYNPSDIKGTVKDITEETIKNEKLNEYTEKINHLRYINKHEKDKTKYNVNTPLDKLKERHQQLKEENRMKNFEKKKNINI